MPADEMMGVVELDPNRVKPFADQPRKRFSGINKLRESIYRIGQTTPVSVTECADENYDAELIDGERRLRACQLGGMLVKAIFTTVKTDEERFVQSVAANFCRQAHDPLEIMEAVCRLHNHGRTVKEIAGALGKTASWVVQYYSLHRLAPEVREALKPATTRAQTKTKGRMSLSLALALVPLDHDAQIKAYREIKAGGMTIAKARTHIAKAAMASGKKPGAKLSDGKRLQAIASAVSSCKAVVERYLDMPGREVSALLSGATKQEMVELAGDIEGLCESLLMLSDALTDKRKSS